MNIWIGDYLKLRNDIHYLEFKVTDKELSPRELKATELQLKERREREESFKNAINSFKGLENKILKLKYIEGMTLEKIGYKLGYSPNYIKIKHAEVMKIISQYETISKQLELFKKNSSRQRPK